MKTFRTKVRAGDIVKQRVEKWRNAKKLANLFPDRYELICKIVDSNERGLKKLIWCLYEFKDYSLKPIVADESHEGLSLYGWNITFKCLHDPSKLYSLRSASYEFLESRRVI